MRFSGGVFGLLSACLLVSCSTPKPAGPPPIETKIEPPTVEGRVSPDEVSGDKDFESVDLYLSRIATNSSPETLWWANYKRAQLWEKRDPNVSCENFVDLAQQPKFPLRTLAFLHAYEVCPKDNQVLTRLGDLDPSEFQPWYKDLLVQVEIDVAKEKHNNLSLARLYLQKSRAALRRDVKVKWCNRALFAIAHAHVARAKKSAFVKKIRARIYSLSPSRNPRVDKRMFLDVANDFRFRRKFALAHRYYTAVLRGRSFDTVDKLEAYKGLRLMYKIEQNQTQALRTAKLMARYITHVYRLSKKTPDDVSLYADTMLIYARDLWTENRNADARRTLSVMARALKDKGSLVEVDWMRGRMAEEMRHFSQAIRWFNRALSEPGLSDSMKNRLLWYLAWNDRKAGLFNQAEAVFKDLATRNENTYEHGRDEFWLAKTEMKNHETDSAKSEFSDIMKNDPYGYYGLLAARELSDPLTAGPLRGPAASSSSSSEDAYFDWLVSVNETQIAGRYLDSVARDLLKSSPHSVKKWTALLQKYALSKNYLGMFDRLSDLDAFTRHQILAKNPQLAFPMPYFDTVAQSSTRYGINVELIYAIMRQESSFNPLARSQMDAFGLLQLLPQVAARTARANSIEYHGASDLYEPDTNIPIAAAYLRQLWDKFHGDPVLVIASYNARDEAIMSWLKTRYRGDTLAFIEDIPYDETRDYVKLVLRNLITYRMLNNSQDTMIFPEWALRISK